MPFGFFNTGLCTIEIQSWCIHNELAVRQTLNNVQLRLVVCSSRADYVAWMTICRNFTDSRYMLHLVFQRKAQKKSSENWLCGVMQLPKNLAKSLPIPVIVNSLDTVLDRDKGIRSQKSCLWNSQKACWQKHAMQALMQDRHDIFMHISSKFNCMQALLPSPSEHPKSDKPKWNAYNNPSWTASLLISSGNMYVSQMYRCDIKLLLSKGH